MSGYLWWQRGIVYQVYPRSFMDSNGDGVGDLPGITRRLDYLRWLGVDAVWISPFYPSPMRDFGYDVSDYTGVHPMFGTLDDFDRLLHEAHGRGLRVILDFVPNHTSDRHPWFLESRSSRDNPKRDWYIWRDPAPDGGPPNNWLSCFGGSAWEWDGATGQYYYHAFLKEQPDLNWRNPRVQEAMLDVLRFWLDRGVDGFRVDVIWHLAKDDRFRDNPPNPAWRPGMDPYQQLVPVHTTDRPEVHEIITRMRRLFDRYEERVLIGEIYLPVERLVEYYGADLSGVHLPFNFQLILAPWDARHIAGLVDEYEAALPPGGWPNWVLGNHDQHRIATRVGPEQARVAAMLLLTLRGTPTLYYGDEIGMEDVEIPRHRVQDPLEKNVPGLGLGRDPERTPMQWSPAPNAGFTTGEPWLPMAGNYRVINVETERDDPRSTLTLYRRLIDLRRGEPALEVGRFEPVAAEGSVLAYVRRARQGESDFLVALNLGRQPQTLRCPERAREGTIALSTHLDRGGERVSGELRLRGDEGVLVRLREEPSAPGPGGDRRRAEDRSWSGEPGRE
ncbi:MAG TPA: alpha-amylase family glycosyl hydrolase [Longimicrobiaceae bacterium]|nr:alpha-amylase family glycosyl hydrolase [Longimicrobiaceae bacterium]